MDRGLSNAYVFACATDPPRYLGGYQLQACAGNGRVRPSNAGSVQREVRSPLRRYGAASITLDAPSLPQKSQTVNPGSPMVKAGRSVIYLLLILCVLRSLRSSSFPSLPSFSHSLPEIRLLPSSHPKPSLSEKISSNKDFSACLR